MTTITIIAARFARPRSRWHHDFEAEVKGRLLNLLKTAAARGEINPLTDFESAAAMLMVIGDGVQLRRVADRSFDVEKVLPLVFHITEHLLGNPAAERNVSEGNSE